MHADRLFGIIGAAAQSMVTQRFLQFADPRIRGGEVLRARLRLGKKSVSSLPLFRSIVMNRGVAKDMETGSELLRFNAASPIERKPRMVGIDENESERLVGLPVNL